MTTPIIEVRGLRELIKRMQAFPQQMEAAAKTTMDAALLTLWENVPEYPDPPQNSTYRRTGTLGRTLGSSEAGGKGGKPDVYLTRKLGGGNIEGRFGTKLEYAPYVIGDDTQADVHKGRWWTMKTIAENASEKIERLFNTLADKLAAFLERQNG